MVVVIKFVVATYLDGGGGCDAARVARVAMESAHGEASSEGSNFYIRLCT